MSSTAQSPASVACACRTGCELLTVRDVARLLKIYPATIWRMAAFAEAGHGNFPRPLRLGPKTVRWRAADVDRYLSALAAGGAP